MGRSPDVVVIGAGVVGAACAYHLAGAGVRVRLLDRSYVASGSSGACEGNVLAWDKELERELPLALRSADLWQRLAAELPDDFEYDRKGSIVVAETEEELRACAERNRVLAGLGVSGEVLDADALRREEPYAAHDLPGGVLYPGDAQLEPRLATAALVRAAIARGAQLATGVVVERIVRGADGRATAVETATGRIDADMVVVAAGVWTPQLLGTCGLTVPVTPRKGQVVVLERSPVASAASSARPATSPPSRPTTPSCRSRWWWSPRRPAPPCSAPAASTSASTARSRSASRARSPAARPASSRCCATRARCACTPACAR